MNRVVYPKEKELIVMAQKKKDSKMMGKIIKTAVSGVLCVALAGGMVAANVLIPPNASSVQSILGLKSGGIDNSKAKTEGINMEYSKPGFDTEAALIEDEIALNKKIAAEGIVLLKNDAGKMPDCAQIRPFTRVLCFSNEKTVFTGSNPSPGTTSPVSAPQLSSISLPNI